VKIKTFYYIKISLFVLQPTFKSLYGHSGVSGITLIDPYFLASDPIEYMKTKTKIGQESIVFTDVKKLIVVLSPFQCKNWIWTKQKFPQCHSVEEKNVCEVQIIGKNSRFIKCSQFNHCDDAIFPTSA